MDCPQRFHRALMEPRALWGRGFFLTHCPLVTWPGWGRGRLPRTLQAHPVRHRTNRFLPGVLRNARKLPVRPRVPPSVDRGSVASGRMKFFHGRGSRAARLAHGRRGWPAPASTVWSPLTDRRIAANRSRPLTPADRHPHELAESLFWNNQECATGIAHSGGVSPIQENGRKCPQNRGYRPSWPNRVRTVLGAGPAKGGPVRRSGNAPRWSHRFGGPLWSALSSRRPRHRVCGGPLLRSVGERPPRDLPPMVGVANVCGCARHRGDRSVVAACESLLRGPLAHEGEAGPSQIFLNQSRHHGFTGLAFSRYGNPEGGSGRLRAGHRPTLPFLQ